MIYVSVSGALVYTGGVTFRNQGATAQCEKSQVAGISFGGQMHGLVAFDSEDRVIRPAILWNDGRTGEEADYLNEVIGKDKLSEYTANIAFAGFTAPEILWMKKHEPENLAKIRKIMLPAVGYGEYPDVETIAKELVKVVDMVGQ